MAEKENPANIVTLALAARPKPARRKSRYRVIEYHNHAGSIAWRVDGYAPDGKRVRENYADAKTAQCRQLELECEALKTPVDKAVRATSLSEDALRVCEFACLKLGDDWARLPDAVDHWLRAGGKAIPVDSPRLDEAVGLYLKWMAASDLRAITKTQWRIRMNLFKNSAPNVRLSEATPEFIECFLDGRKVSAATKSTDLRAVSRFFSWCVERPRRWVNFNPCHSVKIKKPRNGHQPEILSLAQCEAILSAAETHDDGAFVPYIAACLFGGLRPTEAQRLDWKQVNFADGEIALSQDQTKTGKSRVVKISGTLAAWLKTHSDRPFCPPNFCRRFQAVRQAAGLKTWTPDVMRHTSISHYFRLTGSYGLCAEQHGNSEAIIKNHYQGRVSSQDTEAFYQIMPGKGASR